MPRNNREPLPARRRPLSLVCRAAASLLMLATLLLARAFAEDWPTFRHDPARSGISPVELAWPLDECWVFRSPHAPQPAWGDPKPVPIEDILELRRVHFDDAFQVVAADGSVYFGSSADNKVYCLGLETGDVRWTKITGGPVRLAPTVAGGRVYVASDDGYAYCLAADDGAEVWTFHAAPEARRMLGHGKMISPWPSRTSVLVDRGTAYFGAGIFPAEGVFLYAVNADNGQVVWRNDSTGENPQSRVSPQGYLLASETMLYAPMGRVSPAALRRSSGELVYETSFGKQVGGSYALLAGDHVYTGTEEMVAFSQQTRDRFAAFPGRRMVVGEQAYFLATGTHLIAMDRKTRAELWKTACPCADELIQAGHSLVAGGAGRVLAVDAATGQVRWNVAVEGSAKGLAVIDGRLLVSTDQGRIYCFSPPGSPSRGVVSPPGVSDPFADSPLSPLFKQAAETILAQTSVRRGYCLVWGCETGQLAWELARRSDLMIYAVSPDAEKVAAARRAIDAGGLYGARICVEQWPLENVPYADYFANLIVSETSLVTGQLPGDPNEAFRMLKPLGGTLMVGQPATDSSSVRPLDNAAAEAWRTALAAADARLTRERGTWLTCVRGALAGGGSWTHQYGNPGNTACSDDQLVKCPLGLLWFGSPGPGKMQNRHERAAAPLSQDGRMFVQGENSLMAYDIYNGLLLWQRDIAGASRPNASHDAGNLAVSPQGLFVGVGPKCLRLDPATGETRAEFPLPPGPDGFQRWGYVATSDKRLYGSRSGAKAGESDAVLAFDTESGQQSWSYESRTIAHNAIAIGGDTLFLVTSAITEEQRGALRDEERQKIAQLPAEKRGQAEKALEKADLRTVVALDLQTGNVRWQKPVNLTDCGPAVSAMCHNGVLVLFGVYLDGHYWKEFFAGQFESRRIIALSADDGSGLWTKPVGYRVRPLIIGDTLHAEPWAFDLRTGQPRTRVNPVTGREELWQFARPGHHCGCPSAAPHCLFFRSWNLGYYDLLGDYGTMHFGGQRPGCWINFLAAGGLVVMPEASTGCMCDFPNHATVVFQPVKRQKAWALYSTAGPITPVKRLGLNLGAPGDRRDSQGELWLACPRPTGSLVLNWSVDTGFYGGGRFQSENSVYSEITGTDNPWLFASAARGLRKLAIPLLAAGDGKAQYRVRLGFSEPEDSAAAKRVFDVRLQGQVVATRFDIAREAGGGRRAVWKEFTGVEVEDALLVELVAGGNPTQLSDMPLLHALEIVRERFLAPGCTVPGFLLNDRQPTQSGTIRLANLDDQPYRGRLVLEAPQGLAVDPREVPLELSAESRSEHEVRVTVGPNVTPGTYEIPVRLLRPDGALELQRALHVEHLGPRGRVVLKAVEDAHVTRNAADRNFGAGSVLLVDGGDQQMADRLHSLVLLKFRIAVPGRPVSARLRIANAGNPTGDAGRVCLVEAPWTEAKVTYATRPELGRELARLGRMAEREVVERELPVELLIVPELSLAIDPTSTDGYDLPSRESGSAAELVVEYEPE